MIRSLRQSDRQMVIALGILLPGAFAVGIVARKPAPLVSEFPAALAAAPHLFENIEWRRVDLFKNSPIKVSLLCEHRGAGAFAFAFSAAEDFAQPDLLVYWISGTSNFTNALPENAQLLGIFNSLSDVVLPLKAATQTGVLLLYSLADNKIVDVSKPIRPNASAP